MLAISLLSKGVGSLLTVALLAVLFAIDVRRADRRGTGPSTHLPTIALGALFVVVVIVRFAVYA